VFDEVRLHLLIMPDDFNQLLRLIGSLALVIAENKLCSCKCSLLMMI
jgi:hypothetical protein